VPPATPELPCPCGPSALVLMRVVQPLCPPSTSPVLDSS